MNPSDLLTPTELADRLKLPITWVYEQTRSNATRRKPLPCLRAGRYLRFDWQEVCDWLKQKDTFADCSKRLN